MASKKRLQEIKRKQEAQHLEAYKAFEKKATVLYKRLYEIEQAKSPTMGADVICVRRCHSSEAKLVTPKSKSPEYRHVSRR